jgi:hypothetical protein
VKSAAKSSAPAKKWTPAPSSSSSVDTEPIPTPKP